MNRRRSLLLSVFEKETPPFSFKMMTTTKQHEILKVKLLVMHSSDFDNFLSREDLIILKRGGLLISTFSLQNAENEKEMQNNNLIADLFDFTITDSFIKKKVPYPEMFFRICLNFGFSPKQVLVLSRNDDLINDVKKAVTSSGCHYVSRVKTMEDIIGKIDLINKKLETEPIVTEWIQSTQVIISLIKEDDEYLKAGFGYPGKHILQLMISTTCGSQWTSHDSGICSKSKYEFSYYFYCSQRGL